MVRLASNRRLRRFPSKKYSVKLSWIFIAPLFSLHPFFTPQLRRIFREYTPLPFFWWKQNSQTGPPFFCETEVPFPRSYGTQVVFLFWFFQLFSRVRKSALRWGMEVQPWLGEKKETARREKPLLVIPPSSFAEKELFFLLSHSRKKGQMASSRKGGKKGRHDLMSLFFLSAFFAKQKNVHPLLSFLPSHMALPLSSAAAAVLN